MTVSPSLAQWPADTSAPLRDTTVGDVLREAADAAGDRVALVAGMPEAAQRRRWTYAQLLADSERVARALLARHRPGDRLAIWAPNLPEWLLVEYGAALAGIVLVTVNPAFRSRELEYVLRQSRANGIMMVPEFRGNHMLDTLASIRDGLAELREVTLLGELDAYCEEASSDETLPAVRPGDAAQIQYTSGTTGFPKGALLHHRGITNNAMLVAARCGVEEGAVWVNPMPMFHTGGCVLGALCPVTRRATHVPLLAFEPGLMLELLETERANICGAVPTMLIALMEHPDFAGRDLSALHTVVSGGAQVPAELVRRVEARLGVRFSTVFGQTEASPVITQTRRDDATDDKANTVGQPLPQTEVRVIDPVTGEVVPVDVVGEICTRGYLVMDGYFEMPEATAAAIDAEGWLHTGDLGAMDARGYLRIQGRLKDMIIRGGENIYAREVEEVLYQHPSVGDVAVVGVPDERWGEQVAAVVRAAPDATVDAADLFAYVRSSLAPHKTPRLWATVDTFPLTASGKVQKFVLRDRLVSGELPSTEL